MTDKQDPIAHAARLLREAAEELRQAHAYSNSEGWENETDAKAAYDEHMAAAQALEDWEAAVGAGGVQPLRSVQEGCKLVPLEPTPEMLAALMSPGEAEVLASSPSETFALMLMDRAGIRERYSAMPGAAPDASTAPQQEAQEPVAFRCLHEWDGLARTSMPPKYACKHCHNFFDAPPSPTPQPAPAPLSEREAFESTWENLYGKKPVLWDTVFKEAKMDVPAHSAGKYFYLDARAAWKAWQARAALAAQGGKV